MKFPSEEAKIAFINSEIKALNHYNECYRNGTPKITDLEYDKMLEDLKELDPTNLIFDKAIIEKKPMDREEPLPIKMASMNKIKTIEEIKAWGKSKHLANDTVLVLTPKFDGLSLLHNETGNFETWTRGDGEIGQNVGHNYSYTDNEYTGQNGHSIGEAIIKKTIFEQKYSKAVLGEELGYANPRNMVASLFRSSTPDYEKLADVSFVRYSYVPHDGEKMGKVAQLIELNQWMNKEECKFIIVDFSDLTEELLNKLYIDWSTEFELDGIIVDVADVELRAHLGYETNGNPAFARAYKGDFEEIKETIIQDITWQISKDGVLVPVAQVNPVNLEGATVTNVTLYNAKYVLENGLCKGVSVTLKRSGKVIPKIVAVLNPDNFDEQMLRDSFEYFVQWDLTRVNLCLVNHNQDWKIQELCHFFKTMKVDDIGEPTIAKLYNHGIDSVGKWVKLGLEELSSIEGFANISAGYLLNEIHSKIKSAPLARLMSASNIFSGVGEKTLEVIEYHIQGDDAWSLDELKKLDGIGPITANLFFDNYKLFVEWCKENNLVIPECRVKELPIGNLTANVCFTGIRDKELEKKIIRLGGKVTSSISKNLTDLIVKVKGSGSSKEQKATELGIDILTIEEFLTKYGI